MEKSIGQISYVVFGKKPPKPTKKNSPIEVEIVMAIREFTEREFQKAVKFSCRLIAKNYTEVSVKEFTITNQITFKMKV